MAIEEIVGLPNLSRNSIRENNTCCYAHSTEITNGLSCLPVLLAWLDIGIVGLTWFEK